MIDLCVNLGVLITWYARIGGTFQILSSLMICVSFPSDSAVKQILVTLDEKPGQSFIIEDLDEFHVLVRADDEQRVRRVLEAEVRPFSSTPSHSTLFLTEIRVAGEEYV